MDIRGVEITNQLRSAIRAKLLELGVRYDEELPDYILVMVVNKKSRQQMNEDLYLFLEDSTEPFVDWLHDQVLKKLQKVTVAKKKSSKEIVPTAVVKQEEEHKKPKVEDESNPTSSDIIIKQDRDREFEELVDDLALLNEEDSKVDLKNSEILEDQLERRKSSVHSSDSESNEYTLEKKTSTTSNTINSITTEKQIASPPKLPQTEVLSNKAIDSSAQNLKRSSNVDELLNEKNNQNIKRSKISNDSDSEIKDDHRVKSFINKPRITSVVSVKTRLGVISPTKKLELQSKSGSDVRNTSNKNQLDVRRNETIKERNSFNRSKSVDRRKQRNEGLRNEQGRDRSKSGSSSKNDKPNRAVDLRDKDRLSSNKSGTIKSRLGISNTHKQDKPPAKSTNFTKVSKPRISNVKSRLGVRSKQQSRGLLGAMSRLSQITQNNKSYPEEDDDTESVINTSLKSHIIAVKKPKLQKLKSTSLEPLKKQSDSNKNNKNNKKKEDDKTKITDEDENEETDLSKVPSKIIVTPRPLKPLQPSQKRATQSLLLRAVAEANQSVVMQKKMDPCLKEQKPVNKIKITRDPWKGKILSVNLNSKKRFYMDKIQIELSNPDSINSSKAHSSQIVTDEHMDVVKSLFKRTDDKQKFLVTLNGYNNNILKERNSDDEERLEMEVNEDDELALGNNQYEAYIDNDHMIDEHDHDINEEDVDTDYMEQKIEYSKNDNAENLNLQENSSKKRRKLSPIVYTRSRSSSPINKSTVASTVSTVLRVDKRPVISSVITTVADKSSEKCRYWPNCTLGIKCAYYHPEVSCSSFPACKFGDKCAYKHPKCKFGSACTKLGCIFSHPPVQCKYHPYCMKPGCPFSHPKTSSSSSLSSLTPDISTVRAKFTWKKKE